MEDIPHKNNPETLVSVPANKDTLRKDQAKKMAETSFSTSKITGILPAMFPTAEDGTADAVEAITAKMKPV